MTTPPPPPGFVLDEEKPKKRKSESPSRPPPGYELDNPTAVDGDTVRDAQDVTIRVWGIDAPELNQPGYRPDYSTVPIGQLSRDFMQDQLDGGVNTFGPQVGSSYGRAVGPITQEEIDLALEALNSGNAFAAPEYIDDPERRFDYQSAENLARLNRQGAHQYYADLPEDYRAPGYTPPQRQTVAMFGDTPTPWAGLRKEDANRFLAMAYDPDVPIVEAVRFAREKGAIVSAADIKKSRDYYLKYGEAGGLSYTKAPLYQIDAGDDAAGAGALGFGSGFLFEGLDEAGAVVDMLGGTPGRENVWNSDRRWADIWYNNQQQNAARLRFNENEYPVATTTGKVGGALTSGIAIPYGAGARTVPQLAKVGAGYGFAEGFLGTDGNVSQRFIGGAQTAPIGAGLSVVGGKALQYAAPKVGEGIDRARTALGLKPGTEGAEAATETVGEGLEAYSEDTVQAQLGDIPAPPEGYKLDKPTRAVVMAKDAEPTRQPDYLTLEPSRPGRVSDPLTEAQMARAAQNIGPQDVLPMPGNLVDGVEDAAGTQAGRFAEATVPNERGLLGRTTLRNWQGEEVSKVGPTDMVGWLRLQGGLKDDGGDLAHMGLNNSARRGLDFVGQEARFGPLVDKEGMSLDDAAQAAWEAGYFPELAERPNVNQFLDALRETHEGTAGRRFLADDAAIIDDYYRQQGDRFALDQQRFEADGLIYQDRSVPADEGAPFPPVRAYEEWPSGGPDFAGNINLNKLDSPQDIKRALAQTERSVGFDAETRGRITQAETEQLAGDLNMTADQLLSRRRGQAFNAEEALAARQILAKSGNELVNAAKRLNGLGDDPGSEELAAFRQAWTRHAAIQEQVAGMTAEAGRTLQQFRMAADSRAVRSDLLEAFVRSGGGKKGLQDAAEVLIDAVEMGPGKFNALAKKAMKPKWRQKVGELYINFLLSNPPTHVVNSVSNTVTAMLQVPEYVAASLVGAARRLVAGKNAKPRILINEVGARSYGLIQGTKEGARLFARALRTGEADDFVSKVEGDEFRAIEGLKGEVIRIPTRLLTAEDQFFKGIARRMAINGLAARKAAREGLKGDALDARIAELSSNPTDDMFEEALDYGRYLTFQGKLGPSGQAISNFTSNNIVAKIVAPFVRTPINLMKFATERSPAAPLLKEWRADFRAGGESRDLAIAKMMLGTGFATLMYQAALDGQITGAVPSDPAKAKLLYADGWQPYSVKIGDRYVSYSRLDPLSTTIGVAADMATLPDGLSERQRDDYHTMLVASIMGNLASKTWLSGMSDFVSALDDPGRYAGNWMERVASSFTVPAGVAGVARAVDPVSRKRESVGEAIQARVPGMSDELLPRRNIFGDIIENDSLGPDLISPFWQSKAKNDPVVAEMLRIGKSVTAPGKQYTEDGERVDFTPEVYDRYHEISGRLVYNSLLGLIGSDKYRNMTDAQRRKAARKAITTARKAAREVLDDPDYPLPEKGSAPSRESGSLPQPSIPPPPPGFALEPAR